MLFRNTPMASSSASISDMLPYIMAQKKLMQNIAGAALQNGVPYPFPPINPNAPIYTPGLLQHSESNATPFALLNLQTAALIAATGTQHSAQTIPQLDVYPSQLTPVVYL